MAFPSLKMLLGVVCVGTAAFIVIASAVTTTVFNIVTRQSQNIGITTYELLLIMLILEQLYLMVLSIGNNRLLVNVTAGVTEKMLKRLYRMSATAVALCSNIYNCI